MHSLPTISIVTPSFNQGQYLEQTIDSVLSQNYPALQYIIIDGGSTDNSVEIIKKHEKHIDFWVSEPDRGQSHAINKGLQVSQNQVFNWICSDDYYAPDSLKLIGGQFKNEQTNVVSGRVCLVDDKQPDKQEFHDGIVLDNTLAKTIARTAMTQPVTFFRRNTILELGGINEVLSYFMDLELWFKYLLSYSTEKICQIPETIAYYRVHTDSKTYKEMDLTKFAYHSLFNVEKNGMFYSMAQQIEAQQQARAIKQLTAGGLNEYIFKLPDNANKEVLLEAINYYLYDFCRRLYYDNQLKKAASLLRSINPAALASEDQKGLSYLKRKTFFANLF